MRRLRQAARSSVLVALGLMAASGAQAARSPLGLWLTEDRGGVISFQPCGSAVCGVIVGLSDWPANGDVKRDWRGRPQCHSILLDRLRPQQDGRLHGTVTNPEDGKTYSAEVWVPADGALRLRGYVGLPLFGSTETWPAFHGHVRPDCHFQ